MVPFATIFVEELYDFLKNGTIFVGEILAYSEMVPF